MSRTGLTLTLLHYDAKDVRTVLDVLDQHFDPAELAVPDDAVIVGYPTPYQVGSVTGDASDQLAAELVERAPDVRFQVSTDACGEFLGSGHVRTSLGTYSYEAGPEGDPVFSLEQLLTARRAATGDPRSPWAVLDELLGVQHFAAASDDARDLGKLHESARTVLVPLCESCDQRRACSCEDEARAMNAAIDTAVRSGMVVRA